MSSLAKSITKHASCARRYSSTAFEKNMRIFDRFNSMMTEIEESMQKQSSNPKKLNVWDRLNLLRDKDSFRLILSPLAGYKAPYGKVVSAGIATAITKVKGRVVMVTVNDWMHKGGTVFPITLKKQLRAQEIARQNAIPTIYVVDSGGAFLPLQAEIFPDRDHGGRTFRNQAVMSSMGIPQISVVCGPCTAGGAYIPTMSGEAAMVEHTGSLYLAGPPLVKAATGESISAEDLGGAYVHCSISGCVDHFTSSEEEAMDRIRQVMTSIDLCQSNRQYPLATDQEEIEDFAMLLPDPEDNYYREFPMMEVISRVVDNGHMQLFKEMYGSTLITGFAKISGHLVGVVANSGPMSPEACLKGTHFILICSQRKIPLIFFHNTHEDDLVDTGAVKQKGTMMSAVACSQEWVWNQSICPPQVPKISVIVGRSFGTSSYAMCNRSMTPNFLFSWPHAVMGGGELDSGQTSSVLTAEDCSSCLYDDGVILPHQTQQMLATCLNICTTYRNTTDTNLSTLRF